MHHLNIDLETFSSEPIGETGAFKYIESPDFEILLFAYSLNGAPVTVIDLAQGETIPPEITAAVFSPDCIKHAYNAALSGGAYQSISVRHFRLSSGGAQCCTDCMPVIQKVLMQPAEL